LDHLIDFAVNDSETHPVVGLCVRKNNLSAIELYTRKQFMVQLADFRDKVTGVEYQRMTRILNPAKLVDLENERKKTK